MTTSKTVLLTAVVFCAALFTLPAQRYAASGMAPKPYSPGILKPDVLSARTENSPAKGISPFSIQNLYLGIEPSLMLPAVFLHGGWKPMTKLGAGGKAEIGYNMDGWLFGLRGGMGYYWKSNTGFAMTDYFRTAYAGVSVSKEIGSKLIPGMPEWFSFSPSLGVGAVFLNTAYKLNEAAASQQISQTAFYADAGIYANFYPKGKAGKYVVPYIGYNVNMIIDKNGLVGTGSVALGVRIYPFAGYKKPVDVAQAVRQISGAVLNETDEAINISLEGFSFESNSYELKEKEQQILQVLVPVLQSYPKNKVQIIGHVALIGDGDETDMPLSLARAQAVADFLEAQEAVARKNLIVEGRGSSDPAASNDTAEGRAKNRRVEINIMKGGKK